MSVVGMPSKAFRQTLSACFTYPPPSPKTAFLALKALITGITGQDGSYLADLLLRKGYEVFGTSRNAGSQLPSAASVSILPLSASPNLTSDVAKILDEIKPDEIYHLAADSFVPNGWTDPQQNMLANYGWTLALLEGIRQHCPSSKFLNACSREVFGSCSGLANEQTEMRPTTPYGINKAASRWMVAAYRRQYGSFATTAILFNHESPRRGHQFVTRKVSKAVVAIARGEQNKLELGSLSAQRDWGFAGDFVEAMWRMLQVDSPQDFVLGTGVTHSIEQLVEVAFSAAGLVWSDHVIGHPELVRTNDDITLAADISFARNILDWQPEVDFPTLVRQMVEADMSSS